MAGFYLQHPTSVSQTMPDVTSCVLTHMTATTAVVVKASNFCHNHSHVQVSVRIDSLWIGQKDANIQTGMVHLVL